MDIEAVADLLAGAPSLVHLERMPARAPRYGALAKPLPPAVATVLGETRLWAHQAEAIDRLRDGQSVVIATGTASGKSRCYQVPIAEAVVDDPPGTALMIFPTKALAQDQLRALTALGVDELIAATYDGDTSPEARTWIRRHANVILTNPEMLHVSLLPSHGRWATFLRRLRYVVVDELHVLRGIFGSHVGHLLRRLRRLCAHYGSSPTFVFASATIGEPATLASALCGLPVHPIVEDASPRGERLIALWNPPLLDESSGARRSPNVDAAGVMTALIEAGCRTVTFCRSRKATELVAARVKASLPPELARLVRPYRSGYLASERREIEAALFGGELVGVVATNALELGVDVGGLDACVLNGFPGTIASLWQQAGRAGRGTDPSIAVLVAGTDQLDQWVMTHPEEVFRRSPEPAVVNLENATVLRPHLACAAYEQPLTLDDEHYWGDALSDGVRELVLSDALRLREGKAYWAGRGSPSPGIGLRSGALDEVRIITDDDRLVGTVEGTRAAWLVHPGAVYLHHGQAYRVEELDLDERVALVEPYDGDEYTQVRAETSVRVLDVEERRRVGRLERLLAVVEVTSTVTGYERRSTIDHAVTGRVALELPPSCLRTRAFVDVVTPDLLARARLTAERVPGTLHAAEHAGIGILPLFTICDRWDVGGVSTAYLPELDAPGIVVYDGYPGGAGIAEQGFAAARRHLEATRAVVERCPCRHGCPSCVQSPKCGNGNEPLDKGGALALLRTVLASS